MITQGSPILGLPCFIIFLLSENNVFFFYSQLEVMAMV